MKNLFDNGATATFSACGSYRYRLTREWGLGPTCVFLMLNPSTADAVVLDPTVRRCVDFAKREGCGRLVVVNLFALKATDPAAMKASLSPVSEPDDPERNDREIRDACWPDLVIAAWGRHGRHKARADAVMALLQRPLYALGFNADGSPKHPLYVPAAAPLCVFGGK